VKAGPNIVPLELESAPPSEGDKSNAADSKSGQMGTAPPDAKNGEEQKEGAKP
jgi:hypothetical protein